MTSRGRLTIAVDAMGGDFAPVEIVKGAIQAARDGAKLGEIVKLVQRNINRVATCSVFDTLEYLKRGGRISKIQALMGNMMQIHPILGMKDGEVVSFGRERSRASALDYLYNFVMGYKHIEEMSVACYKAVEDADNLIERLNAKFPKERVFRSKTSPVIGAHTGPNLLVVAVLGDK